MEKILKEKDKHGILAKVKEGAENIQTKVQAKVDSVVKNIGEVNQGTYSHLKFTVILIKLTRTCCRFIHQ